MEIRNLKAFLKVAALKNFTLTAKELGYSQANVSAQIKQLEEEVGAPLFNRIGRSVTLTQHGQEMIPYARSIVSTAEQMENMLKPEAELGGTIRVGMVESLFDAFAEDILLEYHNRFPKVQLELVVDSTTALKESLKRATLDMAFVIDEVLPQNEWQVLCSAEAQIIVAASAGHPLSRKKRVALRELADQDFILMESSAPYGIRFRNELARQQIELRPFLTLQRSDMARKLLEDGRFLSVLPRYTLADSLAADKLCELPVTGLDIRQAVQTILHKDKVPTKQLLGFAALLEARMDDGLS